MTATSVGRDRGGPHGDHQPNVPLPEFVELYREMIRRYGAMVSGPSYQPAAAGQRAFFNWWCGDLDKEAVMRWLGDVGNIYVWQERYSRAVERLAREEKCRWWMSVEPFWTTAIWSRPSALTGTHPNTVGQGLITQAFQNFGRGLRLAGQTV